VRDLEALPLDAAPPVEVEHEVVAVRAELDLEIALVRAEEEELDDLVLPEPLGRPGRAHRRRVAVERRVDLEGERVALEARADEDAFGRRRTLAAPGPSNAQLAPRAFGPGQRVLAKAATRDLAAAPRGGQAEEAQTEERGRRRLGNGVHRPGVARSAGSGAGK